MASAEDPRRRDALALAALAAWVLVWLWPIGAGVRMPVGGDVTQFQIGLMGEYDRALAEGRLPLWNANWGFGFPGLAESQMGVYYPPHVALYGLFNTETAYTLSLVLHLIWAAWGTYWLARVLGVSPLGAFLAGAAWSVSGFSVIHLSHQWAYTVGSWMPWAWGLAWRVGRVTGGVRSALGLACVLAVQVLPGHFQLAFITQVTVLVVGLASMLGREPATIEDPLPPGGGPGRGGDVREAVARPLAFRVVGLFAAVTLVLPLTACQLWPTWQLARRAETDRTFEYLSGFATHWLHLVSYVAPGLFHWSPLWRPIAWDPLRTSPEEHLGYIGLAPLALALAAVWAGWRRDRATRTLMIVGLVSLYLSLGPNVPGFAELIRLPGFSFFRAPARWGSATMLAGAVLAGVGFDRAAGMVGERRARYLVAVLVCVVPLIAAGLTEMALAATSASPPTWYVEPARLIGLPAMSPGTPLGGLMAAARRPSDNPIVIGQLRRLGLDERAVLVDERGSVYTREAVETVAVALLLLLLLTGVRDRRAARAPFILLTLLDLWLLGRHRGIEDAPMRPLVEQSPVLARLAEATRDEGGRTLDPFGNLGMVAGAAPVLSYRTLDLPAAPGLETSLRGFRGSVFETYAAETLADVRDLVSTDLGEGFGRNRDPSDADREVIDDPALASWLYGRRSIEPTKPAGVTAGPITFQVHRRRLPRSRAWLLAAGLVVDDEAPPASSGVTRLPVMQLAGSPQFRDAVASEAPTPESRVVGPIELVDDGPRQLLLAELYDPEWSATWVEVAGRTAPGDIASTRGDRPGGLMQVATPGPGRWTLRMRYEGRAAKQGLAVSIAAWAAWLVAWWWAGRRRAIRV